MPSAMLGQGQGHAYLYNRGGENRLYDFPVEATLLLEWERNLSETGTARLILDANLCDCTWLGRVRAIRHELVIYRNADRVWEGPVTRVAYTQSSMTLIAKDVSWWFGRRGIKTRFQTGNVVDVGLQLMRDALVYDDVNIRPHLLGTSTKGESFTADYNAYDGYTLDALDDCVEAGMDWSVLGRRVYAWASVNPVMQTNLLRTPQDISAEVTVYEDGESLATRMIATGGDTYGAAVLTNGLGATPAVADREPVVINYAMNPSLKIDTRGFKPHTTRFFSVARRTGSTWPAAIGGSWGELSVIRPAKDSKAEGDYNSYEITLSTYDQRLSPVAKGQMISASLVVRPTGPDLTKMSLGLRGKRTDGTIDDRAFIEGPPVEMKANTDVELFVNGPVPEDITEVWVEVSRDTSVNWKDNADGFLFDKYGLWVGRAETWFDGDTTDTSTSVYVWSTGSPGQTRSLRYWNNSNPRAPQDWPEETEYQQRISAYYGLVEQIVDSHATTRVDAETAAKTAVMRSNPTPLGIDIPQDAPMLPGAPVTIQELMPGTIIPIQSRSTCRQVGAMPILETVKCAYDPTGERITVTLVTSQAWEIDPPVDPDAPDGGDEDFAGEGD